MALDTKLILEALNERFAALEVMFDNFLNSGSKDSTAPASSSSPSKQGAAQEASKAVIADNWGGLFDGGDDLDATVSNTASAESVGLHDVPACDPATPAPELPVGIMSSTTSTATPPIIADNWGRLFDQPSHILDECDLESVAQSAAASATTSPVNTATTSVAIAPISEDFESAALLCDVLDQSPPRRVTASSTSSQASTTSPAATMPASVALQPASSDAVSVARMRDEVDQQQVPVASPRWPRPTMPASPCSAPPSLSWDPSPPRRSMSDAEDRAASRLPILEEGNKALNQALARREGELQLVQMKYADEACMLTVVQGQLKELTEDTVPRNMPDRCLMNCLILSRSCFSPPFSYSWDAVICWRHRPWPPPSRPQSESCEAELRPLPWPSFDMVERYFTTSASLVSVG